MAAVAGSARRRTRWALGCVLALTASLAACSAGSSTSSAPAAGGGSDDSFRASAGQGAAGQDAAEAKPAAAPARDSAPASGIQQRVVRTAEVVIEVTDLARSAARVRTLAEGLGGVVASESTTFTGAGAPLEDTKPGEKAAVKRVAQPGQSVLLIRVPEPSMERALGQLSGPGGVGKELRRSSSAQDVTADLADLESRVANQRASVARVRALLDRATSLSDIVKLEGELSRREAELEAAQARRAALAGRAELATVTVDLRTAEVEVAEPAEEDRSSFLTGLRSGWRAVVESTNVVLTVLGALLPVAVVGALIGLPLWSLSRRSRTRRRRVVVVAPGSPSSSVFPADDQAGTAPGDRPAD